MHKTYQIREKGNFNTTTALDSCDPAFLKEIFTKLLAKIERRIGLRKNTYIVFVLLVPLLLAACSSDMGRKINEDNQESKTAKATQRNIHQEKISTIPSNYELTVLINEARKITETKLCGNATDPGTQKAILKFYSKKYTNILIKRTKKEDTTFCQDQSNSENPFRFNMTINDFNKNKLRLSFVERITHQDETSFALYHYTFIKEQSNWVIDDVQKKVGDSSGDKVISEEMTKTFFGDDYDLHKDELTLINFLGTPIPQVLTIHYENGRSIVNVFKYEKKHDTWKKIHENREHESYDGMENLAVFGSAPLMEDTKKEQAIIGLQTGSAANFSFYVLGMKGNKLHKLIDQMDVPLYEGYAEIDGKEVVVTSKQNEIFRFSFDKFGKVKINGDYQFGMPASPEDSLHYNNNKYHFSINFPSSWKNKYFVREIDNRTYNVNAPDSTQPSAVYAFGMVGNGKFVDTLLWLAVFDDVDETVFKSFYENDPLFNNVLASKDGVVLVASYPGEMSSQLYEPPYEELGNQLAQMIADSKELTSAHFK